MLDREKIDITKVANAVLTYANDDSSVQISIHRVERKDYDSAEAEEQRSENTTWKELNPQDNLKVVLFPRNEKNA